MDEIAIAIGKLVFVIWVGLISTVIIPIIYGGLYLVYFCITWKNNK